MKNYTYLVTIKAATSEKADEVMAERLNHDEDYGFFYEVAYEKETS